MLALRIEPARERDATRMARMSRRLIEHGLAWRWTPQALLAQIRDPDTIVIVARDPETDPSIVGFAVMQYRFEREVAHLVLLAVDRAARRRGLGRSLVAWLEKVARTGGICEITVEVRADNDGARRFYRALGYAEGARVRKYYDGRLDAIRLSARLGRRRPPAGTTLPGT